MLCLSTKFLNALTCCWQLHIQMWYITYSIYNQDNSPKYFKYMTNLFSIIEHSYFYDVWIMTEAFHCRHYHHLLYSSWCRMFYWFEWANPTFGGLIFLYSDHSKKWMTVAIGIGFLASHSHLLQSHSASKMLLRNTWNFLIRFDHRIIHYPFNWNKIKRKCKSKTELN